MRASSHSIEPSRYDNPALGFAATIASILLFSLMDASVKWLGGHYPTSQIMFFRCAVALLPVLIIVYLRGGPGILRTSNAGLHLLRSLLGISAMGFAFYAFSLMPLAEAVSILHTAPLFMTLLSMLLLGEKVGLRRASAIACGFLGVLLVARPGTGMLASGSLFMLLAAFLIGCTTTVIRYLGRIDDPVCITFYFTLTGVLASFGGILLQGWQAPPPGDIALLCLVGLLGGSAQYLMTVGYRYLEIALAAPLKYLSIVFGGIIGYLLWGEIPDVYSLAGITIIAASGLYTLHRELLLGRRTLA